MQDGLFSSGLVYRELSATRVTTAVVKTAMQSLSLSLDLSLSLRTTVSLQFSFNWTHSVASDNAIYGESLTGFLRTTVSCDNPIMVFLSPDVLRIPLIEL